MESAHEQGAGRRVVQLRRQIDAESHLVLSLVALRRGVGLEDLLHKSRCQAEIALTRQIGMYLMHVMLGKTYAEVGQVFARDRTTVAYACRLVEDRREAAPFDAAVAEIELAIAAARRLISVREAIHVAA